MLTYEDFEIGRAFPLGPRTISQEEIIDYALEFDPQPFHLDPESEAAHAVGGLIASGWHTCAILMRMMCDSYLLESASQGSGGLDEIKWLLPVRPGDTLSGIATIADRRVSRSRPNLGLLQMVYELKNQNGETVLITKGSSMVGLAEGAA